MSQSFNPSHLLPYLLILFLTAMGNDAFGDDYQLGLGHKVSDKMTVGGYFSLEFGKGDKTDELVLDDLAFLAYGNLTPGFSYLFELESVEPYIYDFETDKSETNFPPSIERLYGDFKFSDSANLRVGKFITPIGYWNLQPINVLRDTSSNPRYSRETFPKFLTGIDLHGYTPFDNDLAYHFFVQATQDLDDAYINIPIDQHVGVTLNKQLTQDWHAGMSVGEYHQTDDTDVQYIQFNARWDVGRYRVSIEAIANRLDTPGFATEQKRSAYLQLEHRISERHMLIARYEYLNDDFSNEKETIRVLGYSYRPVFPVSLKAEYQWHSDSSDNQLLTSFSVLF